jgi:mRNA interferase MazF
VRRGEVWWADLPAPIGRRPVVLLSRNEAYVVRESVTIAEVTALVRGIRSEVAIGKREGLRHPSVVNADNLQTLRKSRLRERLGALSPDKLAALDAALAYSLALLPPREG